MHVTTCRCGCRCSASAQAESGLCGECAAGCCGDSDAVRCYACSTTASRAELKTAMNRLGRLVAVCTGCTCSRCGEIMGDPWPSAQGAICEHCADEY